MDAILCLVAILVIFLAAFAIKRMDSFRFPDSPTASCECSAISNNFEQQMILNSKIVELLNVQSASLQNLEHQISLIMAPNSMESGLTKDWITNMLDQKQNQMSSIIDEKFIRIDRLEKSISQTFAENNKKLDAFEKDLATKRNQMEQRISPSIQQPVSTVSAIPCASSQPTMSQPCSVPENILPTISGIQSQYINTQFGSGWIIILDNKTGGFYTRWDEYCRGFGTVGRTFWIGLKNLYQLTSRAPHELAIEMTATTGERRYARYDRIEIGSEDQQFALLRLGRHSGTAGDGLSAHRNYSFSTFDHGPGSGCSNKHGHGGWWFFHGGNCYESCLTGNADRTTSFGTIWGKFKDGEQFTYLKCATMMIREIK